MVDWAEAGVNLVITLIGTFVAVVAAFYVDRHAMRRSERRQKAEEKTRLRAMRRDLAHSVRENLTFLKLIQTGGARTEGRWLPVALLRFSVWEAHRGEYVRTETNAEERKAVTAFFERLRTLQIMAGLGRMERERLRTAIQDPNRRPEPPFSPTLEGIEDALGRTLREAITMGETLAPRLDMEPSRWRRKRIQP